VREKSILGDGFMVKEGFLERYLDTLLRGDRSSCRSVIEEVLQSGTPANLVYIDVIWPIMVEIDHLLHIGKISPIQEHLATRINRAIVNQLQNKLPRRPCRDKKITVCCTPEELQELGAQIMADLFESDGWDVKFLGGGLTNDDILAFVNEYSPDVLLIYGTSPKQAPAIRQLIDTIRDVNAWPNMRIMVSGGLFNRAEGLWEEIGADLFAATGAEAIQVALSEKVAEGDEQREINRRKRRRKKMLKAQALEVV
jgi:methanogenic corrinoid protein MtbC1